MSVGALTPTSADGVASMKDVLGHLEQLKADAAECVRIRDLATDEAARDLYARLAAHLDVLAAQIEKVIADSANARTH